MWRLGDEPADERLHFSEQRESLARAALLGVTTDLALVVGLSCGFISVWAGMVSAALPLVLRRLRVDPAVVSAPLITTVVDGTGLVIYFETAKRILSL